MTFLWQFNIILNKILDYRKIGVDTPLEELDKYIQDYPLLRQCETNVLIKLGTSLDLFIQKDDKKIHITKLGLKFLKFSDTYNLTRLTNLQKDLLVNLILNKWILGDLKNYVFKKDNRILIYKAHRSKYCATLNSMLKSLNLLKDYQNNNFFELETNYNEYWESNFQITKKISEFHHEIQDYSEYWEKIVKGKKFTEEDLNKILQRQKIIGNIGEEIAFNTEKRIVSKYTNPNLVEQVKLIARDYVDKGYDILSVNQDGTKKYIEVKTVGGNVSRIFLSRNEYYKSIDYDGDYWIYFVNLKEKKVRMFNDIYKLIDNKILVLEPTLYEINIPLHKIIHKKIDITDSEIDFEKYY